MSGSFRRVRRGVVLTTAVMALAGTASPSVSIFATERFGVGPLPTHQGAGDGILDEAAYSLLFRFLITMPDGISGQRARAYMRYMGLGKGCLACSTVASSLLSSTEERDIDDFIVVLDEYRRRIAILDAEAGRVRAESDRTLSSEQAREQLASLQLQKDQLVLRYRLLLPERLGADVASKIDEFVQVRFKPRVRRLSSSR